MSPCPAPELAHISAHVGWFGGCAGGHVEVTGLGPVAVMMWEPVWIFDGLVAAVKASGGDPLQLTRLLSGISDRYPLLR